MVKFLKDNGIDMVISDDQSASEALARLMQAAEDSIIKEHMM